MKKIIQKIKESPINYFSDLFIIAMVLLWIFDSLYETIIASIVTISSVIISIQTMTPCFDTSMWSSIGANIAIPLGAGGALWMIKNAIQHAIMNSKGKQCPEDFPAVEADGVYDNELQTEKPLTIDNNEEDEIIDDNIEEADSEDANT